MESDGEGRSLTNSTGVSFGQSNVSTLSPGSSPAVLDDPIVSSRADHEDCMVDLGITVIEHTCLVEMPV